MLFTELATSKTKGYQPKIVVAISDSYYIYIL